jgi:hypothetical protein
LFPRFSWHEPVSSDHISAGGSPCRSPYNLYVVRIAFGLLSSVTCSGIRPAWPADDAGSEAGA